MLDHDRADPDASSDALHRGLLAVGAACGLLIDPSTRAWAEATALREALSELPSDRVHTLTPPHPALEPSFMPRLFLLEPRAPRDSAALRASVEQSMLELDGASRGNGRSVCLWLPLMSRETMPGVATALSRKLVHRSPRGATTLVRWFDPAVLWLLWPALTVTQRSALLGMTAGAWLLDPDGVLAHVSVERGDAWAALALEADQWIHLDLISAVNTALHDSAVPANCKARLAMTALPALRRAHQRGFDDKADLTAIARHAMTISPVFDRHPLIEARLCVRQPGEYYTSLIDDLTPEAWQAIAAT